MVDFLELQFPTDISINSKGGPKWRTVITQSVSGRETRLIKWSSVKALYDVRYGVKTMDQLHALVDVFNECRGMGYGFRYKDWLDFEATDESLTVDGSPTAQLTKVYGSGLNNYTRTISKPVPGVTLKRNAGTFTDFSIDTTTGVLTFTTPLASVTITGITKAANASILAVAHGRSVGDRVYFTDVVGMTEINTMIGTVQSVTDVDNFTVNIDSTGYSTYISGGVGDVYVENADSFTWSGEFDVPVRFASDFLDIDLSTDSIGSTTIPLEEIRI